MNRLVSLAAVAALLAVPACSTHSKSDEQAALDACRSLADAARDRPEGSGMTGAKDYDKFVDECMRNKGFR